MPRAKNTQKGQLGRSLMKNIQKKKYTPNELAQTEARFIHTDNNDEDRQKAEIKNLASVIDQNNLDEFLQHAVLSEKQFDGQRGIKIAKDQQGQELIYDPKMDEEGFDYNVKKNLLLSNLRIPRKPKWDKTTTTKELHRMENESFLEWRRGLAKVENDHYYIQITPYEKNPEVWKQLWRVVERSDILVQIVDGRDPLFYRCEDLEAYVNEVGQGKQNFLLINKSDLISEDIRKLWNKHFIDNGIDHIFFSAKQEQEKINNAPEIKKNVLYDYEEEEKRKKLKLENYVNSYKLASREHLISSLQNFIIQQKKIKKQQQKDLKKKKVQKKEKIEPIEEKQEENDEEEEKQQEKQEEQQQENEEEQKTQEVKQVLPKFDSDDEEEGEGVEQKQNAQKEFAKDLDDIDKEFDFDNDQEQVEEAKSDQNDEQHSVSDKNEDDFEEDEDYEEIFGGSDMKVTIGMVGYPNVGKSSVVNALCNKKLVGVGNMPGKTRNFQTIYIQDDVILCDCPGLVFPNAGSTRAEMVLNGVLPIDKLVDYYSPVDLLVNRIPVQVFEQLYNLNIGVTDINASTLLCAYAKRKGYLREKAQPDEAKSAKLILKNVINGILIYCKVPPTYDPEVSGQIWQSNDLSTLKQRKEQQQLTSEQEQAEGTLNKDYKQTLEQKQSQTKQQQLESEMFQEEFNSNQHIQFDGNDLVDLINGKKVHGIKLTKQQKREIKFSYQRGEEIDYKSILESDQIKNYSYQPKIKNKNPKFSNNNI